MNLSLILHPLDYSAGAKPALARALALAKWHDADLHVLHVRSRRQAIDGDEAALDSEDIYSMVPSRASQTNRIGGLASW